METPLACRHDWGEHARSEHGWVSPGDVVESMQHDVNWSAVHQNVFKAVSRTEIEGICREKLIGKQTESCALAALQARSEEHLKHSCRWLLFEQHYFCSKACDITALQKMRLALLSAFHWSHWYQVKYFHAPTEQIEGEIAYSAEVETALDRLFYAIDHSSFIIDEEQWRTLHSSLPASSHLFLALHYHWPPPLRSVFRTPFGRSPSLRSLWSSPCRCSCSHSPRCLT